MSHASIPLFIPHLACKNDCVFCNQRRIAGTLEPPTDPYGFFTAAVAELLPHFCEVDLAFFGGSFTGLEEKDMIFYLDAASRVKKENPAVTGIRLSTRPDYINSHILEILRDYGVTAVELGAQSMCESVLLASNRGHTSDDTRRASELIKQYGFELVLQFMPGLPNDTKETALQTACEIASLCPDAVRIYPCVVIKDTRLEEMYKSGNFTPLTVEQAVDICAEIIPMLTKKGIRVLRTGLHSSDLVRSQSVVAGPFHPAFGELVSSRIFLTNARCLLKNNPPKADTVLYVAKGCTSKMIGQKRSNLIALKNEFGFNFFVSEKPELTGYETERQTV